MSQGASRRRLQELLHPCGRARHRALRLVDRLAVRGEQQVRLAVGQNATGDDGRRLALDAAVGPLRRRQRPDLAVPVDEVAAEGDARAVDVDEIRDRPGRVARGRQCVDLEGPVPPCAVLRDCTRHLDRFQEGEAILTQVVVVHDPAPAPVLIDVRDQLALERGHPDPHARRDGAGEALHLVAVVVCDEHVRHPLDTELLEPVENEAAAEIDRDRVGALRQDVHVARVGDARQARREPADRTRHLHPVWQRLHVSTFRR